VSLSMPIDVLVVLEKPFSLTQRLEPRFEISVLNKRERILRFGEGMGDVRDMRPSASAKASARQA
jgi:hypothetical protein